MNRVTIMPCVSAGGAQGPSLWVFKGTCLPCREVQVGNERVSETLHLFLTGDELVAMEPETPGVNAKRAFTSGLRSSPNVSDTLLLAVVKYFLLKTDTRVV